MKKKKENLQNNIVIKDEYKNYSVVLDNLCFDYREGTETLKNISIKIKKGEYVSLIGHNGSGKSTLARLIIGILVQKSGDIYINGELMTDYSVLKLRKNIGIVFQNPDNQFIGSTVRDDIAFGLENLCVDPKEMDPLINAYAEIVGALNLLDKEPQNLSGGQKQRVAIAGTLVKKPSILLLDEATAMLDPKGKKEIFNLIHRMKEENPDLTIISITHEIDEAAKSDRVIVLNKGEVYMDGNPKDILSDISSLNKIKLVPPFYITLREKLIESGLNISRDSKSTEEVIKEICQL